MFVVDMPTRLKCAILPKYYIVSKHPKISHITHNIVQFLNIYRMLPNTIITYSQIASNNNVSLYIRPPVSKAFYYVLCLRQNRILLICMSSIATFRACGKHNALIIYDIISVLLSNEN